MLVVTHRVDIVARPGHPTSHDVAHIAPVVEVGGLQADRREQYACLLHVKKETRG